MALKYIITNKEHEYGISEEAVEVFYSADGSITIKQAYKEVKLPLELVDAFNDIYRIVYEQFCNSVEDVLEARQKESVKEVNDD